VKNRLNLVAFGSVLIDIYLHRYVTISNRHLCRFLRL